MRNKSERGDFLDELKKLHLHTYMHQVYIYLVFSIPPLSGTKKKTRGGDFFRAPSTSPVSYALHQVNTHNHSLLMYHEAITSHMLIAHDQILLPRSKLRPTPKCSGWPAAQTSNSTPQNTNSTHMKKHSKVVFCRACVFRVRVWKYYLQNSQKFRGGTRILYPYPYPHPGIFTRAYPYPGYCAMGVQNLQKFRVRVIPRVWFCKYPTVYPAEHNFFTCKSSGHGYGSLTELAEVPFTGMEVLQNSHKFSVGIRMLYPHPYPYPCILKRAYPYPGYCGTGEQNLHKFRVRV